MFERPTLRTLVERTLADTLSRLTESEQLLRSDARVYARVLAGASHELHGHLQWIAQQVIYDTADAEFLERWASLWAILRKPAEFASGSVTATGAGTLLVGTLYRRADGAEFTVTASTVVPGDVQVQALVAGAAGNTAAGTQLSLMTPVAGVNTVATVVSLVNGSDVEDDASLRARFLSRIRKPPNGGSDNDYVQWALEVPGVTRAWVFPQELGPGTVTVRFVRDGDLSIIPDAGEVAAVLAHIESVRPVTAQVYVFAPVAVPLNFTIQLTPDMPEVRAAVTASLADLIQRESEPGATTLLSHIREAISTAAGEADHVLTVPAANVVHTSAQMATMGVITWL
jgi:uncharacterized phage protein gp47/JayE